MTSPSNEPFVRAVCAYFDALEDHLCPQDAPQDKPQERPQEPPQDSLVEPPQERRTLTVVKEVKEELSKSEGCTYTPRTRGTKRP